MKSLRHAKAGTWLKIVSMPMDTFGARFVRLGITVGSRIRCIEHLPGGTIVIQKNRQQVAIGHNLASQISVILVENEG